MTRRYQLTNEFVNDIPDDLSEGVLYISMEFGAIAHKCCCGCGNKVFTPLGPTEWQLTYNGIGISLSSSVGSGNLPCRSHYWVRDSKVVWLPPITAEQTLASRRLDAMAKFRHYGPGQIEVATPTADHKVSKWRIVRWLRRQ